MSFWRSTLRKRRKAHLCETCGQKVKAGEHSWDDAGVTDGDFSFYKQCRACHDIARYFFKFGVFYENFYCLSELADYARDEGLLWPPVWGYVNGSSDEGKIA